MDALGSLRVKQDLLSPTAQWTKRCIDILISLAVILLSAPIMLLMALAIRLDSRGPVFYFQERAGRHGKPFRLVKFRTMRPNADAALKAYLEEDHRLRLEWERFQKLSADPRTTRVGKWLRKWSLDELPQIFNVLQGDMSVVGPRPIVFGQEEAYGRDYALYERVRPGLTGLWQVSGRNRLTFRERARVDGYYVRNWSPWLDIYILARTPAAILSGEGLPDQPVDPQARLPVN